MMPAITPARMDAIFRLSIIFTPVYKFYQTLYHNQKMKSMHRKKKRSRLLAAPQ